MKKILALLYALRTIKKDRGPSPGAGFVSIDKDGDIQLYSATLRTFLNGIYEGPYANGGSISFYILNGKARIRI